MYKTVNQPTIYRMFLQMGECRMGSTGVSPLAGNPYTILVPQGLQPKSQSKLACSNCSNLLSFAACRYQ